MRARLTTLVAMTLILFSCQTPVKDPGAFRRQNPVTAGAPGLMWTPGGRIGFAALLEAPKFEDRTVLHDKKGEAAWSINPDVDEFAARRVRMRQYGVSTGVMHFPWNESSLFWGLTLAWRYSRAAYSERVRDFNLNQPQWANVEWTDRSLAIALPFGMSRNYTNKSTVMGGIGPSMAIARDRNMISDGTAANVDPELRGKTLAAYDESHKAIDFHLTGMIGFSF